MTLEQKLAQAWKIKKPLAGSTSQGFGENRIPLYKELGMKGHNGIDIAAAYGTNIFAPCRMRVTEIWDDPRGAGYGIHVKALSPVLLDEYELEFVMGHFQKLTGKYKVGDWLDPETLMGECGCTGSCTGPHLHLGIRIRNKNAGIINYNNGYFGYIDPDPFMDGHVADVDRIYKAFDGKLVKSTGSNRVYLIENKTKRWFPNEYILWSYGYHLWNNVATLAPFEVNAIPEGEPIEYNQTKELITTGEEFVNNVIPELKNKVK